MGGGAVGAAAVAAGNWRELTLNPYIVRLRRRPLGNWTLALACARQRLSVGSGRPAPMTPSAGRAGV